jgi:hypothetical protein
MKSKSSRRIFDLCRDVDCRAKDDRLHLGIRRGRKSIFSDPVINTMSRGACVSISMAKEAIGAEGRVGEEAGMAFCTVHCKLSGK